MIWRREAYIAHMTFSGSERELFCELFGPLHSLIPQWEAQGATREELELLAFDWDYVPTCPLPVAAGLLGGEERILSDTPEERLILDRYGRRSRLIKRSATLPLPLEHPVSCREDWERLKPRYLWAESRVDRQALARCRARRDAGEVVLFQMPGGYDELRELMGEENLSYAFFDDTRLLEDILTTMGDTCVAALERTAEICPPDVLCVHEDLAGKGGPLLGPTQTRTFLLPYYRRVWDAARAMGCRLFSQDSDGNLEALLPTFLESGVNCFYPFEPMAGMDMVKSRAQYGRAFAVKGGIDKFALRGGKAAIRRELEYKLQPAMLGGGCAFGLDHRIPDGVPLEDYWYYVNTGRELLGLPPISGQGWGRMAFS